MKLFSNKFNNNKKEEKLLEEIKVTPKDSSQVIVVSPVADFDIKVKNIHDKLNDFYNREVMFIQEAVDQFLQSGMKVISSNGINKIKDNNILKVYELQGSIEIENSQGHIFKVLFELSNHERNPNKNLLKIRTFIDDTVLNSYKRLVFAYDNVTKYHSRSKIEVLSYNDFTSPPECDKLLNDIEKIIKKGVIIFGQKLNEQDLIKPN